MNRQDIMQMDERELIEKIVEILGNEWDWMFAETTAFEIAKKFSLFLYLCWGAEEKIKGMGLEHRYGQYLCELLDWVGYADPPWFIIHIHPKQRAQAVLLTVEEK